MIKSRSAFLRAVEQDNSIPIEPAAVQLWLKDIENPFRWTVRPFLQFFLAALLHIVWFIKRLPLPQFSAHGLLQAAICWFCKYFVRNEANQLILRHYATESNILNFLAVNSSPQPPELLKLYPRSITEMREHSFVDHDQELFRMFEELGPWQAPAQPLAPERINWSGWQPIGDQEFTLQARRTQILDFESAHALFMCLFCCLLTRDEYRDAINGFNLDQSIAIRIGQLIGKPQLVELAYNKFPLYPVGPWNLGQRFLMHGFFTEFLYAELEALRSKSGAPTAAPAVAEDLP